MQEGIYSVQMTRVTAGQMIRTKKQSQFFLSRFYTLTQQLTMASPASPLSADEAMPPLVDDVDMDENASAEGQSPAVKLTDEQSLALAELKKTEGNAAYSDARYTEAIALYTDAINVCPPALSAPFYNNRAAALLMSKDYAKALQDAQKAITLDSTFLNGYKRVVKIQLTTGDYAAALQTMQLQGEKTTTKPTQKEITDVVQLQAQHKQLQQLYEQKSYGSILYLAEKLLEASPGAMAIQVLKADTMLALKQYDKARAHADVLYKLEPRNSEVLRVRGLALYYTGSTDLAQKHFSEVLRFDPDNSKCFSMFKMIKLLEKKKAEANAFFSENKNQEAVGVYTECLAIDPLNTEYNSVIYSNRSAAYLKLRKYQDALNDCNRCLDLKPSFLKAKVRKAQCLFELRSWEECIREYTALLQDDQQNQEYRSQVQRAKLELKKSKRKDYYAILGISQSATASEIKKAYRKKALEWHPDKNSESEEAKKKAEQMFKDVNEANETLSDDTKKRRYDSGVDLEDEYEGHGHGHGGRGGFGGGIDINSFFANFMGGQGGGGGGGGGHHGFGGGGRGGFGFG